MCASFPAQILSVNDEGQTAVIVTRHAQTTARCGLLRDVQPGDWVVVYAGWLVEHITATEAQALQELLAELSGPYESV
jgi:hydrogenase assembly chaperone HypC/HupF